MLWLQVCCILICFLCTSLAVGETHYDALGLKSDATHQEIRKAYRTLALKAHPDKNDAPDAFKQFMAVTEAFLVLFDEKRRSNYDAFLRGEPVKVYIPQDFREEDLTFNNYTGGNFHDFADEPMRPLKEQFHHQGFPFFSTESDSQHQHHRSSSKTSKQGKSKKFSKTCKITLKVDGNHVIEETKVCSSTD